MDLHLAGKTAVVTGASRGIGLAVTRALAAEGARVVAGSRASTAELAALVETGSVTAVGVDLSTPDGPARLVDAAVEAYGGLDILVNNVGAAHPRLAGFLDLTDADWEATLALDFLATVRTVRAALPHLLRLPASTIVTVASVNAYLPDPLVIDYSAAKAALLNFCKSISKEFGPRGVRVNTVSPGPVDTALWVGEHGVARTVAGAAGGDPADVVKGALAGTATGRFTHPAEVADLIVLLASDRAGNTTGADFTIDGGLIQTL
jgi:NAD(P)-dependent dehydrogenase (short-subunit alcohol dehydrogenase family)